MFAGTTKRCEATQPRPATLLVRAKPSRAVKPHPVLARMVVVGGRGVGAHAQAAAHAHTSPPSSRRRPSTQTVAAATHATWRRHRPAWRCAQPRGRRGSCCLVEGRHPLSAACFLPQPPFALHLHRWIRSLASTRRWRTSVTWPECTPVDLLGWTQGRAHAECSQAQRCVMRCVMAAACDDAVCDIPITRFRAQHAGEITR